jgi:tetratricopeptide (TPR) repeat protein
MPGQQNRVTAAAEAAAAAVPPVVVADCAAALRSGRWDEVESFARRDLAARPAQPQALTLLGIALSRQARTAEAVACFEQAVTAAPDDAGIRANFAVALRHGGRIDDACRAYAAAAALAPQSAEFQLKLGQAELAAGRSAAALAAFDAALRLQPATPVHYARGLALERLDRHAEAAAAFGAAGAEQPQAPARRIRALLRAGQTDAALAAAQEQAAAAPDDPAAQELLADCLLAQAERVLGRAGRLHGARGDQPAAQRSYARLAQIAPSDPLGWSGQGAALTALREPQAAAAALQRALALVPDDPAALNNLGLATAAAGDHRQALALFERTSALAPHLAEAHSNRGLSLLALGRHRQAAAAFARAVAAQPDCAGAHFNLGVTRLTLGEFAAGWAGFEWRWRVPGAPLRARDFDVPRWQGEAIAHRTILLHAEQGFGDSLQFVRYAAPLIERQARVLLEVPAPLVTLFRQSLPQATVLAQGSALPAFDVHCPLASLPQAFGTELHSIPAAVPYLQADAARRAAWRNRLGPRAGLRIGLVWAGCPQHPDNAQRSIDAKRFAPLINTLPQAQWISLQLGAERGLPPALPALFDAAPFLKDFADTAALVAELDLLLAVDTAVAHLGGALAVPTWLLLPQQADWRWLLEREDSPWYPSLRLFRQRAAGDWDGVFAGVTAALQDCAAGVPAPPAAPAAQRLSV